MASRLPDALKKLAKRETQATNELLGALDSARRNIVADIHHAVDRAGIVTSAKQREDLFRLIKDHYQVMGREVDALMHDLVQRVAIDWHKQATADSGQIVKFNRQRIRRYWQMVHPDNAESLAAVFTQKMSEESIRRLRTAHLDVFRQSQIEGWTANETHKRMQQRWDVLAGGEQSRRFVDAGGRAWTNAHYLQMLTRTTGQRVARDSYIDTLVETGNELARISDDGDPCPICSAWSGLIIRVAGDGKGGGRFPTYEQSQRAGMWHPNCMCRLEYLDETIDADEIQRQRDQSSPGGWDDPEKVQAYRDEIAVKRNRDAGMSKSDAERLVKREKLLRSLRGNLLGKHAGAIEGIPDDVLDAIPMNKVPRFQRTKDGLPSSARRSNKGGVVSLHPKDATDDDVRELIAGLAKPKNPKPTPERPSGKDLPKADAGMRRDIKTALAKSGFSESVQSRIDKYPASVLDKIPVVTATKKGAYYNPSTQTIHMESDAASWSGHPLTLDHEVGHHVHAKTGAIRTGYIDPGLREAIETDYVTWKKAAKAKHGKKWTEYYARNGWQHENEIAQRLGAETYLKASGDQKHRISGLIDALGGMSKGRYGSGHSVAYYRQEGGIHGYKEVYANVFRSIINDWSEYADTMPLTTAWIRRSIGA